MFNKKIYFLFLTVLELFVFSTQADESIDFIFTPTKDKFLLGEPVIVAFTLKNTSTNLYTLELGAGTKGNFYFRPLNTNIMDAIQIQSKKEKEGVKIFDLRQVSPNQEIKKYLILNDWFEILQPGNYLIEASFPFENRTYKAPISIEMVQPKEQEFITLLNTFSNRIASFEGDLEYRNILIYSLAYIKGVEALPFLKQMAEKKYYHAIEGIVQTGGEEAIKILKELSTNNIELVSPKARFQLYLITNQTYRKMIPRESIVHANQESPKQTNLTHALKIKVKPSQVEYILGQPIILEFSITPVTPPLIVNLGYDRTGNIYFLSPYNDNRVYSNSVFKGGISSVPEVEVGTNGYSELILLDEWMTFEKEGKYSIACLLKQGQEAIKTTFDLEITPFDSNKMESWLKETIQKVKESGNITSGNLLFKALQKVELPEAVNVMKDLKNKSDPATSNIIHKVFRTKGTVIID